MILPWLAVSVLFPLAAQGKEVSGDDSLPAPPPRQAVDGLSGFRTVSLVADRLHGQSFELEVLHVFPDRCRVRRQRTDTHDRDFEYRSGGEVFLLPSATLKSIHEPRDRADAVLLRMELHRALFLWPAGFPWSPPEEGRRSAPVHRSAADPQSPVLGTLEAELDETGRPVRMTAVRPDGSTAEAYEVLSRFEEDGRVWPKDLRLLHDGKLVWEEEVRRVDVRMKRNDFAFLPHDRRPQPAPGLVAMDLQSFTFRRVPLEEPPPWDQAVRRYEELVEEDRAELEAAGYALDPTPTFELDEAGRPTACLLRLKKPAHPAPEGWTTRPERSGLAWRRLRSLDEVTSARLGALLRAVPEDSRGGVPYLRRLSYGRLTFVDVYLPLALR